MKPEESKKNQYKPRPDTNHLKRNSNDHKRINKPQLAFDDAELMAKLIPQLMRHKKELPLGLIKLDETILKVTYARNIHEEPEGLAYITSQIIDTIRNPAFEYGYFSFMTINKDEREFSLKASTFTDYNTINSLIKPSEDQLILEVKKIKELKEEQLINTGRYQLKNKQLVVDAQINNIIEAINYLRLTRQLR